MNKTDIFTKEFLSQYKSNVELAKEIGVDESTIRYHRKKYNIPPLRSRNNNIIDKNTYNSFMEKDYRGGLALIIPDCHIPAHDEEAYQLMLSVAKDAKPTEIVIMGDFGDFYSVNGYGKTPGLHTDFNSELKIVRNKLKELRDMFPDSKIVFVEGNHEYRLPRYVVQNAPALEEVVTVNSILGLDELDILYVPYSVYQGYSVLGTDLIARHTPVGGGINFTRTTLAKAVCSMVVGHHHTIQEARMVSFEGKDMRCFCPGWLGDKTHPAFSYVRAPHQWQLGFALVEGRGKEFYHSIIHITGDDTKSCMFNGSIYTNA